MSDKTYLLTIRLPFGGLDTLDARIIANKIIDDLRLSDEEKEGVKLQEVFKAKAPEGISL